MPRFGRLDPAAGVIRALDGEPPAGVGSDAHGVVVPEPRRSGA
ncbi:MAG TPA: hypothetical protein VNO31_39440 [Umezawaea sp.]|nr:hypothetical protein [Umezawaea sp.]